jgi:hypothetical protein
MQKLYNLFAKILKALNRCCCKINLMKHFKSATAAVAVVLLALPGHAQVVTYVGSSTGGAMPGSATDFIFFNTSTYPGSTSNTNRNTNSDSADSVLTSFSFIGGVNAVDGSGSYSSIVTPAGGSALPTGDIQAFGSGVTPALAFEPGVNGSYTTDGGFNSAFNYNDFNVYLMYSNTGGTGVDTAISFSASSLATGLPVGTAAVVPLDGIAGDPPADTNTTATTADYAEFNVTGLGNALQADDSIVFTVSATHAGDFAYIGAASFESVSVPEPRTWAMLLGGFGVLLFVGRLLGKLRF